jgi:uncharacterized protein (UPF0548 family)
MFCWSEPSHGAVTDFLAAQSKQGFSYSAVGYSRQEPPPGFTVDHNRVKLGYGVDTFERAKSAIRQWKMFDISWLSLCWPNAPIEAGVSVAVLISHLGFWSMNASRIVYVVDDTEPRKRFGFAYGTLLDHGEIGEERFLVEFNPEDQAVWYDLFAFSRPRTWARLGYPYARALQKRFARESKLAMVSAVQTS